MASWLVRSTMDQVVQVQALAGEIVLCSWARSTLLSNAGGNTAKNQGRREILYLAIFSEISTTCYE